METSEVNDIPHYPYTNKRYRTYAPYRVEEDYWEPSDSRIHYASSPAYDYWEPQSKHVQFVPLQVYDYRGNQFSNLPQQSPYQKRRFEEVRTNPTKRRATLQTFSILFIFIITVLLINLLSQLIYKRILINNAVTAEAVKKALINVVNYDEFPNGASSSFKGATPILNVTSEYFNSKSTGYLVYPTASL
ncbi:hypothetical protein GINT2_002108 [Glugoides intestinalis]